MKQKALEDVIADLAEYRDDNQKNYMGALGGHDAAKAAYYEGKMDAYGTALAMVMDVVKVAPR